MSLFKRIGRGPAKQGVDWRTGENLLSPDLEKASKKLKKNSGPVGSISKQDKFHLFSYDNYFELSSKKLICKKVLVRGSSTTLSNLNWDKFYEMYKKNSDYFWGLDKVFIAGPYMLRVILALIMHKGNNRENFNYKDVEFPSLIWSLETEGNGKELGVLFDLENKTKIIFDPIPPFKILSGNKDIRISEITAGFIFAKIFSTDAKNLDGSEIEYLD